MKNGSGQPGRRFRPLALRSLPKEAGSGDDRAAWMPDGRAWALCDGASEGYDGAGWAEVLSLYLCAHPDAQDAVAQARIARAGRRPPSDWLSEAAQRRGSWSTALAVRVLPGGRSLEVQAVGDTVFFLLDGSEPVMSFPLSDPSSFGSAPDLVPESEGPAEFSVLQVPLAGLARPRFALATDALAARILSEPAESQASLWRFLLGTPESAFREWARAETDAGRIRKDDLTLVAAG